MANKTYPAEFIYKNLMIGCNVVEASYRNGVKKLLNLGSSCIYPRLAPQPMKEDALLTSELEATNEAYAIAKIAAIKLCRYYNQQYGTNYISVMPTNQYGAGDNFNMETAHLLPMLMRRFHLAKLLRQGDFEAIRRDLKNTGSAGDWTRNLTLKTKILLFPSWHRLELIRTRRSFGATGRFFGR